MTTMTHGTPPADYRVDATLVAGLLADQHPDLAHLPIAHVSAGWDNAMFRLGDDLTVRLPRRAAGAQLILHEQAWLAQIGARLPLPTPRPLRIGMPGRGYPCRWSVVPWLHGNPADLFPPDSSQAAVFGQFLRALHQPAPADAPPNPVRGGPLQGRRPAFEERLARVAGRADLITRRILAIWQQALAAPIDGVPVWLHGDLHPQNILVENGALAGIIDWGDMTGGDCATDLAAIWMLFDEAHARREALAAYGPISEATLRRACGWAVHLGVTLFDAGRVDNLRHAAVGEHTLRRLNETHFAFCCG